MMTRFNKFSNPQEYTQLPFPSTLFIPTRFDGAKGKDFHFMGREIFRRLLNAVKKLEIGRSYNELWLYGTKGYGKSHLLAALTCYLLFLKRRVVFIPDASETVRNWVSTVRKALLFAWANNREVVHEIMMLDNPQAIIGFLEANLRDEHGQKVILIVDQMNVLESVKTTMRQSGEMQILGYKVVDQRFARS
jgi:ATPase involved in DNA replication initiation